MSSRGEILTLFAAAMLTLATGTPGLAREAARVPPRVTVDGFGPVRVGMRVEQASAALGEPLKPETEPDEDERACYYVYAKGLPKGPAFMLTDGRICRVDVREPGILTAAGLGVGSSEAQVVR